MSNDNVYSWTSLEKFNNDRKLMSDFLKNENWDQNIPEDSMNKEENYVSKQYAQK